jgi:hypothetical protein
MSCDTPARWTPSSLGAYYYYCYYYYYYYYY